MHADTSTVGFHEMVSLGIPYHGAANFDGVPGLVGDSSMGLYFLA